MTGQAAGWRPGAGSPTASTLAATLPLQDRVAVIAGLAAITLLSWAYIVYLAAQMPAMPMQGMAMAQWQPWGVVEFALMLIMWAVMMVAMMVPSAAPMVLLFAAVTRKRVALGEPYTPTAAFLCGYVAVWSAFSLAAVLAQWGLHAAALLSPMMVGTSAWLGGGLLIAAGVYQWLPIKDACLHKCRSPLAFLFSEWRDGTWGAFVMGLRHGAFCTGCCWALMALLFVGGVMNLLWVAAIAGFVLLEKVLPAGGLLGRLTGGVLVAWGLWMMLPRLF